MATYLARSSNIRPTSRIKLEFLSKAFKVLPRTVAVVKVSGDDVLKAVCNKSGTDRGEQISIILDVSY
jgi:hypothetical protein